MRHTVLALLIAFAAVGAGAATLDESFDRAFDVRPGGTLTLKNVNGRITITASNDSRVRVHATKHVEGKADDAKRAMAQLKIEATASGNDVRVETIQPRFDNGNFWDFLFGDHMSSSVTYEVSVPREFGLNVSNTNGRVEAEGVSGNLRLETTNGRIEARSCAGTLDAETTNGGIQAELTQIARGGKVRAETTNGRIDISLPRDAGAEVDAETTNGSIRTDLPITTRVIEKNSLRGTIGAGGTQVRLRTTNGGISIGVSH